MLNITSHETFSINFFCTTHVAFQLKSHFENVFIIEKLSVVSESDHLLECKHISLTMLIKFTFNDERFFFLYKFTLTPIKRFKRHTMILWAPIFTHQRKNLMMMMMKKHLRFYFLDDNIFSDFFCDTIFLVSFSFAFTMCVSV